MNNSHAYHVSIKMGRDSFPLYIDKLTSSIYGVFHLVAPSSDSVPVSPNQITSSIRLQLIGREHISTRVLRTIFDDTYNLSSLSTQWQTSKQDKSPQSMTQAYFLPFEINVPSKSLPNSFQMCIEQESDTVGIDYLLRATIGFHHESNTGVPFLTEDDLIDSNEEVLKKKKQRKRADLVMVYPVHLHRAFFHGNNHQIRLGSLLSRGMVEQYQRKCQQRWPSKVRWGTIVDQKLQQAWYYEIEYPNLFELNDDMIDITGYISLRLKSVAPPPAFHKRKNDSSSDFQISRRGQQASNNSCLNSNKFCLIGYKVMQMVEIDGFRTYYQVLSASTECMKLTATDNQQGWSEPCDINIDLMQHQIYHCNDDDNRISCSDNNWTILPTVPASEYQSLAVDHCIQLTIALDDMMTVEMSLPISIVGYSGLSLFNRSFIPAAINTNSVTSRNDDCQELVGCSPSSSSLFSVEGNVSQDSAIDVTSYRSSTSSSSEKTVLLNTLEKLRDANPKTALIPQHSTAATRNKRY